MISVDTNVLVRIVIDDDKEIEQIKKARQFAKKQQKLFITQLVQVELVWVLDSAYDIEKSNIISILRHLQENEAFVLQNLKNFEVALFLYQRHSADFSDCLIYAESAEANLSVVTFDKKFSKLDNMKLL